MIKALIATILSLSVHYHSFHLSFCEMKYVPKQKTVQVTMRIFVDDLEETIQSQYPDTFIDILKPEDPIQMDSIVSSYVIDKLSVSINNNECQLIPIGTRIDEDTMMIYFEITNIKKIKTVYIKNSTLLERFDNQINVVNFKNDKAKKSLQLNSGNQTGIIDFQ